jgi:hypothetical protein
MSQPVLAPFIQPDWPAPPGVRALGSTRAGGVSAMPYASLNLGDHVGDDPTHVAENRQRWAQTLGVRPVYLNQVHGMQVARLTPATPDATVADACLTDLPGVACTVMVADCLPVLWATRSGTVVAASHAGWRGLAGQGGVGVLEQTYAQICLVAGMDAAQAATEIMAWLGPCIGPQAFEVGPEVRQAFVEQAGEAVQCFVAAPGGKWLADLPALARQRLQHLGVSALYGNDSSPDWCTASNPQRFFSHRRDRVSGRLAASIWRV